MLSSLLGPAKPPVASSEDVASDIGVYRLQMRASDGSLTASALNGSNQLSIAVGERCLVCLCDYEPTEEVRQLRKCTHVFHRQCIDLVSRWMVCYSARFADIFTVANHRT